MGKFFHKFNIAFDAATLKYGQTFTFFLRHKWVTLVLFAIAGGGIYFANKNLQTGFVPNEDQGFVLMDASIDSWSFYGACSQSVARGKQRPQ